LQRRKLLRRKLQRRRNNLFLPTYQKTPPYGGVFWCSLIFASVFYIAVYNRAMKHINAPYAKPETYFFLGVIGFVGILTYLIFLPFLITVILSMTVAVVVYPAYKKLLKFCKGNKTLASLLMIVALILVVIIPTFLIAAQIFNETTSTYYSLTSGTDNISLLLDNVQGTLNTFIEGFVPGLTVDVRNYITKGSQFVLKNIGSFFSGTLSVGLHLVLGIFALFYFLRDGRSFVSLFEKNGLLLPEYADLLIRKIRISIQSIIGGKIIVAILQGIATGIALFFFGVPSPAFWGTISGLASLVPMLGTGVVIGPAVLYLFITGNMFGAIGLAVTGIFFIGFIDNFLSPYLIGDKLQIHPLVILFAILGGIAFFGPSGFILGPLVVSLMVVLLEIYRLMMRDKQEAEIKQ